MERITSGIPEFDDIVGGGLPARAIHTVIGPPGSGKTILTEQTAFANAGGDRPVLYLSTLSEPLQKFIAFVQRYQFADLDRIGSDIIYDDLFYDAADISDIGARLRSLIHEHRPKLMIIDSFKAIADLSPDLPSWRRLLYELAGLLTAYDTTSFWVGEYTSDMTTQVAEFAVADSIIELSRQQQGTRDDRFLRVLKLRGSGFRDGFHAVRLSRAGLEVFPRLVTPADTPPHEPTRDRVASGIEGLDDMLHGGWPRGTSVLLAGPSGSGKTIFALHFLREGVREGESGLLVNFQENPYQTAANMRSLGWTPETLVAPGRLDQFYISPVELQIDSIVRDLIARVEAHDVRRVVIDALGDLERSSPDPVRFRDYVYSLAQWLSVRNITVLLLFETGGLLMDIPTGPHHGISYISDNILLLEMDLGERDLSRSARVIKSRGSPHDGRPRSFEITDRGPVMEVL